MTKIKNKCKIKKVEKTKARFIFLLIILLFTGLIVMGCANKKIKIKDAQGQNSGEKIEIKSVEMPAEQVEEEPKISDEQILADYDDGLSDALAEIEMVD